MSSSSPEDLQTGYAVDISPEPEVTEDKDHTPRIWGKEKPKVQAPGRKSSTHSHALGTKEAKRLALRAIQNGRTVREAMAEVGRSEKTYKYWKETDAPWAAEVRLIRDIKRAGNTLDTRQEKASSFEEFRTTYLNMETFPHQSRWVDLIEGREPANLHPSMRYHKGDPQMLLINTPPEHAKSTVLSVDYVTYRICVDPNVRVILCSVNQDLAKQFLYAIKQRLTHPRWAKLQVHFAPPEGFNGSDAVWSSTQVYLGGEARDSEEKDPTIQAIGIGGRIYGSRADLIIVDDACVLANASNFEGHRRWLTQEVLTRLGPGGRLIVAGTRVDPMDLYKHLLDEDLYDDGEIPWTYLMQPAVLEFADDPADWVTLWPRGDRPWVGSKRPEDQVKGPDGMYPRWDGFHLAARRKKVDTKTWALAYQQQDVAEDSIFPVKDVRACVNGRRNHGLIRGDLEYHERPEGMAGLYVICSMDPAMAGETATICYAVDIKTGMRFVLDAHRMKAPRPSEIKDLIFAWTEAYTPMCWVIEKNAFQLYLTRDEAVRTFLANRGCSMQEHYTSNNKLDPDFGVASMAPLFTEKQISLPSAHNCEGVKGLVEQLVIWRPGVKGSKLVQDLPMAMWFAELKAREVMDQAMGRVRAHSKSKYLPRYRQAHQQVVPVGEPMWAEGVSWN